MDPALALRAIENALRLAILAVEGDEWIELQGAPERSKLEAKRDDEFRRRDGVQTSQDLLEFTDFYSLKDLILKNWPDFKIVFRDRARFKVYLEVAEDVRNAVAHSRQIALFEKDLLSGIAGHVRTLVSDYRTEKDPSARFYPLIEEVSDTFGNIGLKDTYFADKPLGRLEVGDEIRFRASAFSSLDVELIWKFQDKDSSTYHLPGEDDSLAEVGRGSDVEFKYVVTREDVGEWVVFSVILTSSFDFHRQDLYDDARYFVYQVNPPLPNAL